MKIIVYSNSIYFNAIAREIYRFIKSAVQRSGCQRSIDVRLLNRLVPEHSNNIWIIMGANELQFKDMPKWYIIYQFEQLVPPGKWWTAEYRKILQHSIEIWDYSIINCRFLKQQFDRPVRYVPLGYIDLYRTDNVYLPEATFELQKDIDLLFYGALTDRRKRMIAELKGMGVNVAVYTSGLWGKIKFDTIKRAKYVLNLHHRDSAILETHRITEVLSAGTEVITERSTDIALEKRYERYVTYFDRLDEIPAIMAYGDMTKAALFRQEFKFSDTLKSGILGLLRRVHMDIRSCDIVDRRPLFRHIPVLISDDQFKVPLQEIKDWPFVSVITITKNRPQAIPLMIQNWLETEYPADRIEWIIVDDSDEPNADLQNCPGIRYYHCDPFQSIAVKRDFACALAKGPYIVFMDDDDYYYPDHIRNRIAMLLNYQVPCIGSSSLEVCDLVQEITYRVYSDQLSEASLAFKKSFWEAQHFASPTAVHPCDGEFVAFSAGRREQFLNVPSCFILIVMSHNYNTTGSMRRCDTENYTKNEFTELNVPKETYRLFRRQLVK